MHFQAKICAYFLSKPVNMKKFFMCCGFLLCLSQHNQALPPDLLPSDVRSFSLGHLQALSHEFINPAYLSFHTHTSLGMAVHNQFEIEELNRPSCWAIVPNRLLDCGILFSSFHFSEYRLWVIRTGFSKKLSAGFSIGVNFLYLRETIDDWSENKSIFSSDVGIYCRLSPTVSVALLGSNLLNNSNLNTSLNGGIAIAFSESCHLFIESAWCQLNGLVFRAGMEYELMNQFMIRTGIRNNPVVPCMGVEYALHFLTVAAGFELNTYLGISSAISITYSF